MVNGLSYSYVDVRKYPHLEDVEIYRTADDMAIVFNNKTAMINFKRSPRLNKESIDALGLNREQLDSISSFLYYRAEFNDKISKLMLQDGSREDCIEIAKTAESMRNFAYILEIG